MVLKNSAAFEDSSNPSDSSA